MKEKITAFDRNNITIFGPLIILLPLYIVVRHSLIFGAKLIKCHCSRDKIYSISSTGFNTAVVRSK